VILLRTAKRPPTSTCSRGTEVKISPVMLSWTSGSPSRSRPRATSAFDADEEAIELANDVDFGLAASAWTRDVFRAQNAARLLQAGTVWINDHIPIISEMPHGGMKASGNGKDMSTYSFEEYTQVKHVMADITAVAAKPWHTTIFANA